jgi:hypothetical protein
VLWRSLRRSGNIRPRQHVDPHPGTPRRYAPSIPRSKGALPLGDTHFDNRPPVTGLSQRHQESRSLAALRPFSLVSLHFGWSMACQAEAHSRPSWDLGSGARKGVGVQISLLAPSLTRGLGAQHLPRKARVSQLLVSRTGRILELDVRRVAHRILGNLVTGTHSCDLAL